MCIVISMFISTSYPCIYSYLCLYLYSYLYHIHIVSVFILMFVSVLISVSILILASSISNNFPYHFWFWPCTQQNKIKRPILMYHEIFLSTYCSKLSLSLSLSQRQGACMVWFAINGKRIWEPSLPWTWVSMRLPAHVWTPRVRPIQNLHWSLFFWIKI